MNRVILIGRCGKDPEIKFTPGGTQVASFSIATSEKCKNKSGELVEKTEWHNVTVWGQRSVLDYIKKGTELVVEGKIQTDSYEKDGAKKYITKIVSEKITLIGGNK